MIIKTVDNFQSSNEYKPKIEIKPTIKKNKQNSGYFCYLTKNIKDFKVTLLDYKKENKSFTFFETKEIKNPEHELIISVKKDDEKDDKSYCVQTGNYIGKFNYNGIDIEINSRFSDVFLKRMLNFANDVYLDDVDVAGENTKENFDISKFILYYLFVQKLEKAFLLGLPKTYTTIKHHDINLKGNVDINRFIKNDIPFKGKISSKSREQIEVQEIIDILHKAVSIIEKPKSKFSTKNISHIKIHLKQQRSNKFVSNQTFDKALNHKALNNPIFAPYKEILKLATYIIDQDNLEEKKDGNIKTYEFLVNIASLFELYLVKLLKLHFDDWEIIPKDETKVYGNMFYSRKIVPDIVMKKDNKILVFDAKYKRMKFRGSNENDMGDVDRCDFFQIHTYMSYYKNQGKEVIAGGLLYPIEKEFDCRFNNNECKEDYKDKKAHSDNWLGNSNTEFIIDGVDLTKITKENITQKEENFIGRIKNLFNQT